MKARRAAARGIPPELPPEEIVELPFFGRSWYVHGVSYWFRRAVAVFLMSVGLAVATVIEWRILDGPKDLPPGPGRWAWRAGFTAILIAGFVRPTRTAITEHRRRRAGQPMHPDLYPGTRRRRANLAAGAGLVIGVILFYGWFVYTFYVTLLPEYDQEHDARLDLQQRPRTAT